MGNKIWLSSLYPRTFGWILGKIVCLSICPYYSRTSRIKATTQNAKAWWSLTGGWLLTRVGLQGQNF